MVRNCKVCQKAFTPKRNSNAETCGNRCRQRLHRHRHGTGGSLQRFKESLRPFTGNGTVTSSIVDVTFGSAAQVDGPAAIAAKTAATAVSHPLKSDRPARPAGVARPNRAAGRAKGGAS